MSLRQWLREQFPARDTHVSSAWLRDQARIDAEDRNSFHGPSWRFPVKKLLNDSAIWNRHQQERKRA